MGKILPGRLDGIFSREDFSATSRVTEDRKKPSEDVMLTKIFPSTFFSQIVSTEDENKISTECIFCTTEALVAVLSSEAPKFFHRGGRHRVTWTGCIMYLILTYFLARSSCELQSEI